VFRNTNIAGTCVAQGRQHNCLQKLAGKCEGLMTMVVVVVMMMMMIMMMMIIIIIIIISRKNSYNNDNKRTK
jgi:uncharacterized membrane protein YhaH (DUF805 family)